MRGCFNRITPSLISVSKTPWREKDEGARVANSARPGPLVRYCTSPARIENDPTRASFDLPSSFRLAEDHHARLVHRDSLPGPRIDRDRGQSSTQADSSP